MPSEDVGGSEGISGIVKPGKTDITGDVHMDNMDAVFIIKQKHLEAVLGIHEGATLKEVTSSEDAIMIAQTILSSLDSSALNSKEAIVSAVEELLHQLIPDFKNPADSAVVDPQLKLGSVFKIDFLDTVAGVKSYAILRYFIGTFHRLTELIVSQNFDATMKEYFTDVEAAILSYFTVFLRGYTSDEQTLKDISYSFTRLLLLEQFPQSLLYKVINFALNEDYCDSDCLADIFNPVFDVLRLCVSCSSLLQTNDLVMEKPFILMRSLLQIKVGNNRPLTDVVCARPDFDPKPYTGHRGRELSKLTFLGPFLNLGLCDFGTEFYSYLGSEQYFAGDHIPIDETRFKLYEGYQHRMNSYRRYMFDIVHTCLVNGPTRDKSLEFISSILKANKKRSQLQADATKLATDAFMLNLMYVLLNLSEKITLDKVDMNYIFHPKCRMDVRDETRLKYNSDEVIEYEKELDLTADPKFPTELIEYEKELDLTADPKFPTECFFMTVHAVQLSYNSSTEELKRIKRHVSQINSTIREIEQEIKNATAQNRMNNSLMDNLKRHKLTHKQLVRAMLCFECSLRDRALVDSTLMFTNKQLNFLISMIDPN
uniref:Ubiquitin conjugation factor E4 core domain-containing protein n=1 Tax=Panagrolaimus sp. JU765 TaxID=591449 RepID=A0AC34QXQ0_9BILA